MHIIGKLLFFVLFFCSSGIKAQDIAYAEQSFPQVQHIALKQINNNDSFIRFNNVSLHLLIFLSPECPLCKNYSLVLNRMQEKFGSKVQLYGIVPGRTYTEEDVQRYISDYKIGFPVWIDLQKELSNYVKATITPEVVLLNQSGGLVYRGAIDDWVQALGQRKAKPQQHYLEDAITQFLQKRSVLVKQTNPIGCLINEF